MRKSIKRLLPYVDTILKKHPNDPYGLYLRGRLRLSDNKINEAIEDLKLSIKSEPNHASVHYYLGLAYQASGNLQAAKAELGESLKLNPNP